AASITTAALPAATLCSAYAGTTATATGGTTPYTWSATGLPPGMTIDALTGAISGTPQLATAGAGGTISVPVTLSVTDATPTTTSRTIGLQLIDPNGPLAITAPPAATVPLAGGAVGTFTATPNPTPGAFSPITWTVSPGTGFNPPAPGQTLALVSNGTLPAGPQTIQVTATDTPSCGGAAHTRTISYTFTVQ
ncbi:MAG TPA: putative Ig domain-containing protein, partial [Thermoanaerobaculia bacterium]|nr:putative Ig domain-containing protein [Thermoanaerobaculia bacterium]